LSHQMFIQVVIIPVEQPRHHAQQMMHTPIQLWWGCADSHFPFPFPFPPPKFYPNPDPNPSHTHSSSCGVL
jgi:hypothetical protein